MGVLEADGAFGDTFPPVSKGRHVSAFRQLLNIIGCILIIPFFYLATVQSLFPMTMDMIINVVLTEYNRFANERRRTAFQAKGNGSPSKELDDLETQSPAPTINCMATIVGYREDPDLFFRALESYKSARGPSFILLGIDGDAAEDQEMVDVFNTVYPERSRVIHIPEPLGEIAERVHDEHAARQQEKGRHVNQAECNDVAIRHCMKLARDTLDQQRFLIGPDGIRYLCLSQRHMHKKGIMFTTFIFSLVIADLLGIEYMWSSDSDTLVFEDSLERTISAIAGDATVGGASSGLTVHNGDASVVTRLAQMVYWSELYLTRSTPACTATSDCQSGPSTAFRLSALSGILLPWYQQRVFGKRMIVNEDRHLTTNLLARGWGVIFASDTLTATETPTTLTRWLRQQVRWARATHIESLLIPRVYALSHPIAFYAAARREIGPLVVSLTVLSYFFTSEKLLYFSHSDLFLRIGLTASYNILRNPDRLRPSSALWVLPSMFFYNVPLPAVHIWSLLTLTADTWGTTMRANGELSKKDGTLKKWFETGFYVAWMGIVGGTVARWVANMLDLSQGHRLMFMFVNMVISFFCAWKTTIGSK